MQDTTNYEIAKQVQFNNEAEATAIKDYTDLLQLVAQTNLDEEDKAFIADTINEIIADELNHQEKLQMLYTSLTRVAPNKD